MAARIKSAAKAIDRDVCLIFGGGTGAATSNLTSVVGAGITSITRTGVGLHTITLSDKWKNLLYVDGTVIDATTPDDWEFVVVSEAVATSKTIAIALFKGGTAADLSTDEKIKIMIALSDTAQPPTAR